MPLPERKRLRIKNYDYSSEGYYFVTICSKNKEKLFGDIYDIQSNKVHYTKYGLIAKKHIQQLNQHYKRVSVDKYVIMPNHIHMIIRIGCDGVAHAEKMPTLSNKSGVSKEIGKPLWQRFFHDHVIRNEKSYLRIWEYIDNNPRLWNKDTLYI